MDDFKVIPWSFKSRSPSSNRLIELIRLFLKAMDDFKLFEEDLWCSINIK
ncbi:uncharacterized protein G2W53_008380 [Senna tora]|uniref:Uncharacterized protein n=1 Tax=Senna tora TaxID=362788 RepID=A0A834X8M8_9FABA|nr:uncharacterized protein G2W53_008380 [Senna tora]